MYDKIKDYLEENVTYARFKHSISTARLCSNLCNMFGLDSKIGRISGLSHDIARDLSDEEKIALALKDGLGITEYEKKNPVLLHGRAGAMVLQEKFGISDKSILQAVRWHTTGHPDMNSIAKVLFVADYIEPERKFIDEAYRQKLYLLNLNAMVLNVLSKQITYLRNNGNIIVENSILLYDTLLAEGGIKQIIAG